jgi:hypothetical protein
MEKKKPTVLPGLVNIDTKPKVLAGIKKAADDFTGSALPIMKYFGNVKPSRNERIIKPDMTSSGKITKQDLPIIREVLQPGFSGNFRTNYTPPSTFDADAVAYFTAAGITDTTEKDAVNQLVLDLKGTGSTTNNTDVWAEMLALYPVSPTSLAAAAFNLKNPATYQIDWYNSPSHSSAGIAFNGTTQYGDCNFIPSTALASANDASVGGSVNSVAAGTNYIMGSNVTTSQRFLLYHLTSTINAQLFSTGNGIVNGSYAARDGVFISSRRSSTDLEIYGAGTSLATQTGTHTGTLPNIPVFLSAYNNAGTPLGFSQQTIDFAFLGKGLTDNQVTDIYNAITNYNTALSR